MTVSAHASVPLHVTAVGLRNPDARSDREGFE
jgi:hypothetical protein